VRKGSVLVPTRPLTTIACASFVFLLLDIATACGFFRDISITPACDIGAQDSWGDNEWGEVYIFIEEGR
jgi:hypothetical protein